MLLAPRAELCSFRGSSPLGAFPPLCDPSRHRNKTPKTWRIIGTIAERLRRAPSGSLRDPDCPRDASRGRLDPVQAAMVKHMVAWDTDAGQTPRVSHEYCKRKFLGKKPMRIGEAMLDVQRCTHDIPKETFFEEYIDPIRKYAVGD